MGTGRRCGVLVAVFVLGSAGVSEPSGAGPRFANGAAGISFDVPEGLRAQARPLFVDHGKDRGKNLTLIDLFPADEAPGPGVALVTITVEEVGEPPSLQALASHAEAECEPSAFEDTEVLVGGQAALRRESREFVKVLFASGRRTYRLSAGADQRARQALDEVAATLRFDVPPSTTGADRTAAAALAPGTPIPAAVGDPTVRAVYLVPSDRRPEPGHLRAIERAMRHLQVYYRSQLGGGRTFRLNDPVVEVVATNHPVAWYQNEAPAADPQYRFWNGVTGDGLALTGGTFDDPTNRWLFFIEADSLCGQVGGGGTSGVAVLPANDLRNLLCESLVPSCPGDNTYPGVCVSTGGIGHELGHAFNLPHPAPGSCPAFDPDCGSALMWLGYLEFPNAYLMSEEEDSLLDSPMTAPFFTVLNPGPVAVPCTTGCPPPRPTALSAGVAGPSIELSWSAAAGANSYSVYRATGTGPFEVATTGVSATTWVDTTRPGGQSYSYYVTALGPNGASGNSNTAMATLPPNLLSIADASWLEGDVGTAEATLTVSLSPPSGVAVIVSFMTEAGTAGAGVDYDAMSGEVTIPAGATTATILVPVHGDLEDEIAETVRVRLLTPVNAQIERDEAVLTIEDDDPKVERGFFLVAPCRVLDTREAPGPRGGPALAANGVRTVTLADVCDVPLGAKAVALNLTVTGATGPGHIRVYPADLPTPPEASAVNYLPEASRANNMVVALDPEGRIAIYCGQTEGTVDLIVDVAGYFR